jgi:hypothetical protein
MISSLVEELLKLHPQGGTEYFDALDNAIRYTRKIKQAISDSISDKTLIVSQGKFGETMWDYLNYHYPNLSHICFHTSFRKDSDVHVGTYFRDAGWNDSIIIDDSMYSGKTVVGMYDWCASYMAINVNRILVAYDGSKPDNVLLRGFEIESFYKYYEEEEEWNNS